MTLVSASASAGSFSSPSQSPSVSALSQTSSGSSTTSRTGNALDPSAVDLARKLIALEHLVDAAYVAAGELGAAAVRARKARKLSAVVGHSIFASFSQASCALVEARGHIVKGHRQLGQLAERLDVQALYGDEDKDEGDKRKG